MGRPLNKKFFGDSAGLIRCDAEVDGSGSEACFIVEQRSNSKYRVQTEATFASDALVIGVEYIIVTVGAGTWADAGASSEAVGTVFTATATTNGAGDGTADARAVCKLVLGEPLAVGEMQVEVTPELFVTGAEATIDFGTSDLALIRVGDTATEYAGDFTAGTNYMGGASSNDWTDLAILAAPTNTITRTAGETFTADDFAVGQKLVITNAEDAGNNGTFTIQALTASEITTVEDLTTPNTDDVAMDLAIFDVITLNDGSVVTVDVAGIAGTPAAITAFTVTVADATPLAETTVRAQSTVTGVIATGFDITPDDDTEIPRGVVTSVAIVTGGSGYFTNGTFNISSSSDIRFIAGNEALITFTVLNQAIDSVVVTTPGDGYQSLPNTTDINTADIPDSGTAGTEESARIISAHTVKTFEGHTYMWPAAGGADTAKSKPEADLGTQ